MLHLQGDRVCAQKITKALQLVQSTSPSYLLLASLDAARYQMATQGQELMTKTIALATEASSQLASISHISLLQPKTKPGCHHFDITRLTINLSQLGITGFAADEILHEQLRVTCELPLLNHLSFIISLGNTSQDIKNLIQAFHQLSTINHQLSTINHQLSTINYQLSTINYQPSTINYQLSLSPRQAHFAPTKTIPITEASDRLCGELICPYPPGIPLLMPGEIITAEAIEYLQQILVAGGTITGCNDPTLNTIQVINVK